MQIPLPEALPVMELSGTVLLPNTVVPLYIFEKRYRRMLADVLASHRMFALANSDAEATYPSKEDKTRLLRIATAGIVRMSALNSDGTSTLMLLGAKRVAIEANLSSAPYPLARISEVPSQGAIPTEAAEFLKRRLLRLLSKLEELSGLERNSMIEICQAAPDLETMVHLAMQCGCPSSFVNQRLLETRDLAARVDIALRYFERQISSIQLNSEASKPFGSSGTMEN
ncbi:LON peptidase substrate-binding domain-containing protein [Pelagicoccus sp. SDUM812003]|uniref:LON peptidase substrate-binding domain-containing protein n=1 Tax=Pelagicoccus sp. SDUM812003 TaxID=3041267 RepID=UPI002810166F|nr:LON peptidase substrate-binding domain-containing protein [Pelagicoccus sp. SDUM812003]MDQ8203257.1 LON peptidase substrate-binding domain-containing protein [Pelagicoccus sp. SDUM812003]